MGTIIDDLFKIQAALNIRYSLYTLLSKSEKEQVRDGLETIEKLINLHVNYDAGVVLRPCSECKKVPTITENLFSPRLEIRCCGEGVRLALEFSKHSTIESTQRAKEILGKTWNEKNKC